MEIRGVKFRLDSGRSDAAICRDNGWVVGDVLEGDEGYGPSRIVLTGIGERGILARQISHNGEETRGTEHSWTLQCRDWSKVNDSED